MGWIITLTHYKCDFIPFFEVATFGEYRNQQALIFCGYENKSSFGTLLHGYGR